MTAFWTWIKRPAFVPPLLVGILLCPLLAGIQPLYGDPNLMYQPIKRELARNLREGRLPFWSDSFALGVPLVAESHVAAFYPPNWLLYRTLDAAAAYRLSQWLHYVALAVTAYAYARVLKLSEAASTLVALGFALCGFQAAHAGHEPFYTLMPYLPLCLLLAEKFLSTGRMLWPVLLAMAWGCQLTIGHFQIQMWTAGLVIVTGLWRVLAEGLPRRRWFVLWGSLAFGAAIAWVQLRLTWELTRAANFSRAAQYLSNYHFPIAHWAQWALPSLYLGRASTTDDTYWASLGTTGNEACAYAGIIALVFACVGLLHLRRRSVLCAWWWVSVLAFTLATMPGWCSWGYQLILSIPGLGWFRAPARYTLLSGFGVCLLAGSGLDHAASQGRTRWGLALAVVLGTASAVWWLGMADRPLYRQSFGPATLPWRIGFTAACWVLGLISVIWCRRSRPGLWAPTLLATVELGILFYLGPTRWGAPGDIGQESPMLQRLAAEPSVGLVAGRLQNLPILKGLSVASPDLGITPPPPNFLLEPSLRPPGSLSQVERRWLRRFGVSHGVWAANDDVKTTETLGSLPDPVIEKLFARKEAGPDLSRWLLVRYDDPLPPVRVVLQGRLVQTWETLYSTLSLEDLENAAWFIHGDGSPRTEATARLTPADFLDRTQHPKYVEIDLPAPVATSTLVQSWDGREAMVDHDGSCYVIFRRTYYPGWTYQINGGDGQPVLKVDGGLQCVPLTGTGPSRIRLDYRPTGLDRAAAISLASISLALATLTVCLGRERLARRSHPNPQAGAGHPPTR